MRYTLLSQFDPFTAFNGEQERALARAIAERTGVIPEIVTERSVRSLRFWMRLIDKEIVQRDLDLREFHMRESVKHALRAAVRTVRLDHAGPPIDEPKFVEPPSLETAVSAGYEQALDDFGIDKAGEDNPEGWLDRSLARARWKR